MTAPCKGCEKRKPYCHGSCAEYKAWRDDFEKMKAKIPPNHSLSKSMKKHIYRKMLGR